MCILQLYYKYNIITLLCVHQISCFVLVQVEIQMTKELYNKELDRIHLSYKKKIDSLEKELNLATEKLNSNSSEEVLRTKIDQALLELESKWSKKFDSKESQYLTEKMNNVALKESLTRVEQELSLLQTSMADSSQTLNMQLMSKKKEVDQLNRKLAEQCKEYEQLSTVLQTTSAQHREESQTLRSVHATYIIYLYFSCNKY